LDHQALQSFKQEYARVRAGFSEKLECQTKEMSLGREAQIFFKLNYSIKDVNLRIGT
jgi:hypothetical protein